MSADGKKYVAIPARAKKVRLIFWLSGRGWGAQRVAKLFNTHQIPTWGVGRRAATGWHHSYIKKILDNRSVLGEFLPHTTKPPEGDTKTDKAMRYAVGTILKEYYLRVVTDAAFHKVQLRRTGPHGPVGRKIANLFQGLLKDGDFPKYTMMYKDHGDRWTYVQSDHKRVNPSELIFSWQYQRLETLILNYLVNLDWSGLVGEKRADVKKKADDLTVAEGKLKELDKEVARMVQLVKAAGNIPETVAELNQVESQRKGLRPEVQNLKTNLASRKNFTVEQGSELIKKLAADTSRVDSRLRLRNEIRRYVLKIELYRTVPAELTKGLKLPQNSKNVRIEDMLHARCVRIIFMNKAERWVVDHGEKPGFGLRFDGATLPHHKHLIKQRDEFGGGEIADMREENSIAAKPIKALASKGKTSVAGG